MINSVAPVANRQEQYNEPLDRVVRFFEQYLTTDGNMLPFHFKTLITLNKVILFNLITNINVVKTCEELRLSRYHPGMEADNNFQILARYLATSRMRVSIKIQLKLA